MLIVATVLPIGQALADEDHVVFTSREDHLVLDASAVEWARLALLEPAGLVVEVHLRSVAAAWVAKITRNRVGEEMRVVYRDRVIVSPIIRDPIENGQVIISGLTDEEARAIVDSLPSD